MTELKTESASLAATRIADEAAKSGIASDDANALRCAAAPVNLLSLDRAQMQDFVGTLGEKPYRARQLLQWIYQRGVTDVSAMTDLSKAARTRLQANACIDLPEIQFDRTASDGTRKWLFRLADGNSIETVYIPDGARGTLCVSSQVGCALDCSFCATARQGFNRNLTTGEIIAQLWLANDLLAKASTPADSNENPESRLSESKSLEHISGANKSPNRVTNVVMMGMGEPLLNLKALVPALDIMMDDLCFGLSKRKVTVSTSGVVPHMDKLYAQIDCSLAVSLHAPNDELRNKLVPLNVKYPIAELMAACKRYVEGDRKKHVFFEYVLLAGVNDQPQHARELVELLKDFPAKVNLIPFNPFPASGYTRSGEKAINRFWQILNNAGVLTLRRATRGDDIDAACGQLAGDIEDRSRRHRKFAEPRFGERAGSHEKTGRHDKTGSHNKTGSPVARPIEFIR